MTETTSNEKTHNGSSKKNFFRSDLYLSFLRPAWHISTLLALTILAWVCHASVAVALSGTLSVILMTMARSLKLQLAVFLSVVFLLLTVMLNLWHWADSFFIAIYTGTIIVDRFIFVGGICEAVTVLVTIRIYYTILDKLNLRVTQEWFVKKSQRKFVKVLFFSQVFFFLFWITGYVVHAFEAGSHYDEHLATLVAFITACCLAITLAGLYLYDRRDSESKHSHHHHHHHHSRSDHAEL